MQIKPIIITQLAKLVLGGELWAHCRHLVSSIDPNTTLTGPQKREAVFADLRAIFSDLSVVLLNCGIEIATVWIRSQQK